MYHEKMLSVCKIVNGYLIEVRAPYKRKSEDSGDGEDMPMAASSDMGYGEKEIYAKDHVELGKKIETLIPMLDETFNSESEFESAFKSMA